MDSPFNEKQFDQKVLVFTLKVPVTKLKCFIKQDYLMNFKNIKSILPIEEDSNSKLVFLNQNYETEEHFPKELQQLILQLGVEPQKREVKIGFEQMKINEINSKVVPEEVGIIPSGFETIGTIAHLNLRDSQLPYKKIIGEIILKKTPNIKTVVNKIDKISHQFRFYEMGVKAGQPNFITQVVEDGMRLELNPSKVFLKERKTRFLQKFYELIPLFKREKVVLRVVVYRESVNQNLITANDVNLFLLLVNIKHINERT